MKTRYILIFWAVVLFLAFEVHAQSGQILGDVKDLDTGNMLPGANVVLKGTSLGAASNIDGHYFITNVPPGTYELSAMYIGYEKTNTIVRVGPYEKVTLNIKMKYKIIAGQEVVVTAQAEGQMQAMNQQLSAKTIKNIVSKKQIQELPEANAAEAVGRLPGVSMERGGGEGNKIIIRGMGPKYALVQIDGVNMAATGSNDRSVDLSMISPYMLEGIELTKSVMANQEATATGGIVNFKIKKAPEGASFNVIAQGGMNSLRNTYQDYKLSFGASNRFYSNLVGAYLQADYEEKDAGSEQLGGVWFYQENEKSPVKTNSMQLMDIYRNVKRFGAALVFDFSLPSTMIKASNFYSRINREETNHINMYDFMQQGFRIDYSDTPNRWLTVMTNSLQFEHRWRKFEINSTFSHSYSENILPARISSSNVNSPSNPFPTNRNSNYNVDLDPETIPSLLTVSMNEAVNFMHLGGLTHTESETQERDLAAELNVGYNFNITDQIGIKLNSGAKLKYKTKGYDQLAFSSTNDQFYLDLVYENFENELSQRTRDAWAADDQRILLVDFLDKDYDAGSFLNGKYKFSPIFDKNDFRRMHSLCVDIFDPNNEALTDRDAVLRDFSATVYSDYNGNESYYAFYLMPEINLGTKLLFVPGVRYESNRTEYTGYRGNRLGVMRAFVATPIDTVTKVRKNEFWLPMIQAFYKPTDWLTFKTGYTHTLQRPDYNNIMPGWVIQPQGGISNLSNFRLKPELSKNLDFQLSLHSNKIGLLSAGAFSKDITDMIFWTGQKVIMDTSFFELPTIMHRGRAAYATNNENKALNWGYEFEWQSNFWYLPGLLKGLVMNINYTRNKSKAAYLRTRIKTIIDPKTYRATYFNEDTTYTSPMISQPDHLLNLTLGYDYKGFSIRCALRYMSHVFKSADWYEKLRGYSTDFYRYDLQIRQKMPVKGLEFFMNVNNLTNELERDVINHLNYASYIENYGRSANIGLRYQY